MTQAPENITLKPNHLFGNPWSNAYIGDDDPMEDGEDTSYGYTRTDVTDARIEELQMALRSIEEFRVGPSGQTVAERVMRELATKALKEATND
jgi:hypothetical protein